MPSRLADENEMRSLVGWLMDAGRGVFMLTKGSQTSMPFLEELAADSGRPVLVAALLHEVVDDSRLHDRIVAGQYAALDRLEAKDFGATLLRHVDQVLASPRQPHPPVAFDFWDQVNRAEALDEFKSFRPSAFLTLPPEPFDSVDSSSRANLAQDRPKE